MGAHLLALVVVVATIGLLPSPAQARVPFQFCGTAVDKAPIPSWGPIAIQAKGVPCREAKGIAKAVAKLGYGAWQIDEWSCDYRSRWVVPGQVGESTGTCKRGVQRVKFGWGA